MMPSCPAALPSCLQSRRTARRAQGGHPRCPWRLDRGPSGDAAHRASLPTTHKPLSLLQRCPSSAVLGDALRPEAICPHPGLASQHTPGQQAPALGAAGLRARLFRARVGSSWVPRHGEDLLGCHPSHGSVARCPLATPFRGEVEQRWLFSKYVNISHQIVVSQIFGAGFYPWVFLHCCSSSQ